MSSGYKRTWDGAENHNGDRDSSYGSSKRHQKDRVHDRDRGEPRDWRDVHLDSPRGSGPPAPSSGSRHERDRREDGRKDYGGKRRDDNRHGGDRYRDRERDRERDRPRRDDRSRDRGYKDDRRRSRSRSARQDTPSIPQEEREEGEISPPPSAKRTRTLSPSTSHRTRTSSPYPLSKDPVVPAASGPTTQPAPAQPEPELELEIPASPPPVEDILAARRAKRLAIRAKYEGMASMEVTPSPVTTSANTGIIQPGPPSTREVSVDPASAVAAAGTPATNGAGSKRESMSVSPTPGDFALAKEEEDQNKMQVDQPVAGGAQQISAADYDPSLDRREDEHKRVHNNGIGQSAPETVEDDGEEEEVVEEEEVDDMFAVETTKKVRKVKKKKNVPAPALITTTLDSAADSEGYYTIILGEQLDGKYQVYSHLGKGMFANVVRARVIQGDDVGKEVAIKIVRCQESMYRAGLKEVQILNKLKQADPDDKKHVVRLERTFEHRGHLCLVFESLSMNLRDVVKRFGKDIGLNIRAVRAYAHQLFLSLTLLRKLNIMHADIKPDNILVNEQKTVVKLCDLGSASDASENEVTPYLVSRFYRAPEIILGVPYDPALDIWSIGCTLYELYTGKILFPGRSNNQMLLLMMELKGRFNSKMIKKAKFGDVYFDDMGGFVADAGAGEDGAVKKVHISKPTRDLKARLMPPGVKMKDDESKMVLAFVDLLDKCLQLDPARRITPREALLHPFIRG